MGSAKYYQALALRAMGREDEATDRLEKMLEKAKQQLAEQTKQGFSTSIPQFVFVERGMQTRRRSYLNIVIGQAYLGLGMEIEAKHAFNRVLEDAPRHYEALSELQKLEEAA